MLCQKTKTYYALRLYDFAFGERSNLLLGSVLRNNHLSKTVCLFKNLFYI